MRYLKALGLAAVAAAVLMALVGTGTASATTLCTTNVEPCPVGWRINAEEDSIIEASIINTAKLESTSGTTTFATCTVGSMSGKITNGGGATETVSGPIESLTWAPEGAGCSTKVETKTNGSLEIHWISGGNNGTVTALNSEVTVKLFGVSCEYKAPSTGLHLGTLTGGVDPILDINAVVTVTTGSSFLCPETARWTAEYTISKPRPMYVLSN